VTRRLLDYPEVKSIDLSDELLYAPIKARSQ
jgi:hypothetical protein